MADGQKSSELHKHEKDEIRPKRTKTAYLFYLSSTVPVLMSGKNLNLAEASKEVSENWKKMTDTKKKPFEAKSQ